MFTVNDCNIAYLLYTVGHCLLAGELNSNPMILIRIIKERGMNDPPIKVRLYENCLVLFENH